MRVYFYFEIILKCARMVTFILLELSSQDDLVGQLYQVLGGLTFSPVHKGAYPYGGSLKFFSFVAGQQAFLYWGNGRFLPLSKNLLIPSPPGKLPPSRLPVSNLEKKCIRLLDSAHFHETLTKIYFLTKKSFNVEEEVCENLCIVLC